MTTIYKIRSKEFPHKYFLKLGQNSFLISDKHFDLNRNITPKEMIFTFGCTERWAKIWTDKNKLIQRVRNIDSSSYYYAREGVNYSNYEVVIEFNDVISYEDLDIFIGEK